MDFDSASLLLGFSTGTAIWGATLSSVLVVRWIRDLTSAAE